MALTMGAGVTSCTGDLDLKPTDPNVHTELTSADQWVGYFASLYGGFLYTGNLSTSDGGAGTFTRCHWNLQEITADEAIISNKWNDPGYVALNFNTWLTDNEWIYAAFAREFYMAKQCSEFIAKADGAVAYLGDEEVKAMKAEARVLRGYAYYNMIDLFGRGPWVDENSVTGATPPTYDRKQLFDATVADMVDVINSGDLRPAANQVYGRVSREAARAVLAKLYLNAEVYVGTPMYAECAAQCQEIVKTISKLAPTYKYLFCTTNDRYVGNGEILWAVPQEAGSYDTWGGTTYLTAGCYVETIDPDELIKLGSGGINDKGEKVIMNPWSGVRMRPELSSAFENGDQRRLIYEGQFNQGVENLDDYGITSDGYMCVKFTYTTEEDYENTQKRVLNSQICNTDYPLIRLADVFLMLAECEYKGVKCDGLNYFNQVRKRAGLAAAPMLTADGILKERQCELYFEGCRRSDLIRFGKYTGDNYKWSWKGGTYEGANIPAYRAVFAIPYQYVNTVGQNPGY